MTLDEFFNGREASRRVFDVLSAAIAAVGPAEVRVTKSQVAFRRGKAFAWAWVPGKYLRGRGAPLVLTLSLPERNASPRWKQIVEVNFDPRESALIRGKRDSLVNQPGDLNMDANWRTSLWGQFGAAIDMLGNVVRACPDDLWRVRLWDDVELPGSAEFWYIVYHTLFWLDLYLSGAVEGFAPPAPFNLDELDRAGLLPERPYTGDELLAYLEHDREQCRATIDALTDERAARRCHFPWGEISFAGLLLDNMRHVQEHAAQLNLILGQRAGWSPRWVAQAKD